LSAIQKLSAKNNAFPTKNSFHFLQPSKENTKNQISFLNPKDYLFEYSNRIKEGILSKKTNWEFSLCVGCCNNTADIVIIPCGHTVFCSRCETKWKDKCPYCKSELGRKFFLINLF